MIPEHNPQWFDTAESFFEAKQFQQTRLDWG
jgi:hypothetical protein